MNIRSFFKLLGASVLVGGLLFSGAATAQSEPSLKDVYTTAEAGRLDQAQVMMQQVLVAHPNSAKAHFVQAELFARQGNISRAVESLGTAERLSPGLPSIKPESVRALRAQLGARTAPETRSLPPLTPTNYNAAPKPAPFPWGWVLLLGGAGIALVIYIVNKRKTPGQASYASPMNNPNVGGLNGPQGFGMAGGMPQQAYGQAPSSGLGGRIMGGVATGLAVGAGVMAAEAIGRSLMGGNDAHAAETQGNYDNQNYNNNSNRDMGGQDFGVNDASSWDDGGSAGGGDWGS